VRVAVFFENFGPYHVARLNAAGLVCQVQALEWRGRSATYAWEPVEQGVRFDKRTLLGGDTGRCSNRSLLRLLEKEIDTASLDAIAVNGWGDFGSLAVIAWALERKIPIILMSESTAWDERRSAWREAVKRQLVALGSAALAGGTPHKDYLVQLGMPGERVFLGYDAVDNSYFREKAEILKAEMLKAKTGEQRTEDGSQKSEVREQRSEVREQKSEVREQKSEVRSPPAAPVVRGQDSAFQVSGFSVSAFQKAPFFLASARFIEKKNLPRLIEAYARYREKSGKLKTEKLKAGKLGLEVSACQQVSLSASSPWPLVLLGDGPLSSDLRRLISGLSLVDFVHLPGFKQYPELPAYYANAGAFIHASTTEQWGLVVNEAMASGLPVLVSNRCGCAKDLVQEGVNGFTFDPYNVEQLANLMVQISAFQIVRLSAFGAESARIIANWGPERFASGLKAAMEKALEVGPMKASLVQRLILKLLLAR